MRSNNFLDLIKEFESMFGKETFPSYNLKGISNNSERTLSLKTNVPSVNVFEDEWVFKYEIVTPGLTKEDLSIEINGDTLKFSGEKRGEKTEKGDYVSKEYHISKFHRTFEIPNNVVSDEIYAKAENGITTIFLPKEKPTKSKSYKRAVNID